MGKLTKGNRSVAGRVVLITGSASGIGRATAHLFADEGASVAVADLNAEGVEAVVGEITGAGGRASGWVLDVADPERIKTVVKEVADKLGPIDVLINNAGTSAHVPIDAEDYEERWAKTFAVNLTAHARLIRECLPYLMRNGEGRIVNTASTEGLGATAGISPYTASKHGVIGLTRSLAVELGSKGVTVNCVCPGPIRTGMTQSIDEKDKQKFARRRVPLRRYGEPEELAHGILSLALPASSYINGAVLVIDGGMMAQNT